MNSIFMNYAKALNAGTKGYPSTYVLDSFPIFIITKNEMAQYERSCKHSTFDYLERQCTDHFCMIFLLLDLVLKKLRNIFFHRKRNSRDTLYETVYAAISILLVGNMKMFTHSLHWKFPDCCQYIQSSLQLKADIYVLIHRRYIQPTYENLIYRCRH